MGQWMICIHIFNYTCLPTSQAIPPNTLIKSLKHEEWTSEAVTNAEFSCPYCSQSKLSTITNSIEESYGRENMWLIVQQVLKITSAVQSYCNISIIYPTSQIAYQYASIRRKETVFKWEKTKTSVNIALALTVFPKMHFASRDCSQLL